MLISHGWKRTWPARVTFFVTLTSVTLSSGLAGCGSYSGERAEQSNFVSDQGGYASEEMDSRSEVAAVAAVESRPMRSPAPARPAAAPSYAKKAYSPGQSGGSTGPQQQVHYGKGQLTQAEAKGRELQQPMVVYFGYLKLKVRRQIEAFDQITKLATTAGGYVQSLSGSTVVVRVPASDFDGAMLRFAGVGELLDRKVKAVDVAKQFTDIEGRLQVATQARQRLLLLLERVKNTEERLQILEQIKRLTEAIETAESSLATLRNLADFFTITIDLEPIVTDGTVAQHRSPFAWIRGLTPHLVTLTEGRKAVTMQMPKGFVLFAEDDVFRAQSADTSLLRVGRVANEPKGDAQFWSAAIHHEMEGRDEELVDTRSVGKLQVRVYRNKDVRPRYYVVGVTVAGDHVYALEVFLPDEAAWKAHEADLWQALATLEVKP